MTKTEFVIHGRAAPKGSFKPIKNRKTGRVMLVPQNNKTLAPWQSACKAALSSSKALYGDTPVHVSITYYFERKGPKTLSYNDAAPVRVSGDLDKLNRCIFDELTKSGIIDDDKYITSETSQKRWSDLGYAYVTLSIEEDTFV